MKITAEFNSNEELINFISAFSNKTVTPNPGKLAIVTPIKEDKPAANTKKAEAEEEKKEDIPKVNAEIVGVSDQCSGTVDAEIVKDKDPKVTKEMVRAIFTTLIKAGKQEEAKALTSKYGAKKVPDIKEKDYTAIFNEANALLEA